MTHPAEALLQRREIRRSFSSWCKFILSPKNETPALHHLLIIDLLQKVTDGKLKRLMVMMPPGAAKSTYISVCFPPWWLGQHQTGLILACSYSYSLVEGFGRQCRDIINEHQNILGYNLSTTAAAAGDWRNSKGGGYFCAGVGSGIAGHRADLGFIDDFCGSQEDADSQGIRDKTYEWYRNDFVPRLKPNAARVIVANRRHEEDLIGRILTDEPNLWTILRLPMIAEDLDDPLGRHPGDLLWPEWFTHSMVEEAKKSSRMWATLYQQRPAPEGGDFFKRDWIVEYRPDDLPKNLKKYVGSDHAYRLNQENDLTCLLPAGVDDNGRIWILPDWYWTRADSGMVVEAMLDIAQRHKPLCWWAGREAITGSIAPFLHKRMRERNVYFPIEELSEGKDKMSKAQAIRARMSQKMVLFPSYAPGWDLFLHELLTFPNGKHDDAVDALAKIGQGIDKMIPAERPLVSVKDDLSNFVWTPTLGNIKMSHNRLARYQKMLESDK